MTSYDIVVLAIFMGFFLSVLLMLHVFRSRARRQVRRYEIFALRDKLVKLVGDGKLNSSSPVYEHTVWMMNALIRHLPSFTSSELGRNLAMVDERYRFEEYVRALRDTPLEVQEVVYDFLVVATDIVRENSPSLRAYLWLQKYAAGAAKWIAACLECCRGKGEKPPVWEGYRTIENHMKPIKVAAHEPATH